MIEKIKALCVKYRELIVYVLVGGLTTVISWAAKFLFLYLVYAGTAHPTAGQNTVLSVVENVAGIAAAYPMNRRWVFRSTNPNILSEAAGFVGSRLATMALSWVLNLVLVNLLGLSTFVGTVVSAVVVVIGNYIISKLFVFKK